MLTLGRKRASPLPTLSKPGSPLLPNLSERESPSPRPCHLHHRRISSDALLSLNDKGTAVKLANILAEPDANIFRVQTRRPSLKLGRKEQRQALTERGQQ
jgi:hypothetical protein